MNDLAHEWGGDLGVGPGGDLALASGVVLGQQRVLRRLLTNAGDYIWQLGYGAGLAQAVGETVNATRLRAIVRSQLFNEAAVSTVPEPAVDVAADASGDVFVRLRYTDATNAQTQLVSFSLDR